MNGMTEACTRTVETVRILSCGDSKNTHTRCTVRKMAAAATITIEQALIECDVMVGYENAHFNGNTVAQRIANDVFAKSFSTCIDMTNADLQEDWKTYSSLTVNQGQIRVRVIVKKNIRAMVQWAKDHIRMGIDPSTTPFVLANVKVQDLLDREKSLRIG